MNLCYECRDGDHDDYDSDARMVTVTNPDGGPPKRGRLCLDHREAMAQDGYEVSE